MKPNIASCLLILSLGYTIQDGESANVDILKLGGNPDIPDPYVQGTLKLDSNDDIGFNSALSSSFKPRELNHNRVRYGDIGGHDDSIVRAHRHGKYRDHDNPSSRKHNTGELEPKTHSEIEMKLRAELEPRIRAELRPRIRAELEPRIRAELKPIIRDELEPRVWAVLESRIRTELEPRIRNELEPKIFNRLEPRIRAQLIPKLLTELEPRIRTVLEQKLREELQRDLRALIQRREMAKDIPRIKPLDIKYRIPSKESVGTVKVNEQPSVGSIENNAKVDLPILPPATTIRPETTTSPPPPPPLVGNGKSENQSPVSGSVSSVATPENGKIATPPQVKVPSPSPSSPVVEPAGYSFDQLSALSGMEKMGSMLPLLGLIQKLDDGNETETKNAMQTYMMGALMGGDEETPGSDPGDFRPTKGGDLFASLLAKYGDNSQGNPLAAMMGGASAIGILETSPESGPISPLGAGTAGTNPLSRSVSDAGQTKSVVAGLIPSSSGSTSNSAVAVAASASTPALVASVVSSSTSNETVAAPPNPPVVKL